MAVTTAGLDTGDRTRREALALDLARKLLAEVHAAVPTAGSRATHRPAALREGARAQILAHCGEPNAGA